MITNIAFLKYILLSNFFRLGFPLKISFAITYRCNLRCKVCNIWKKESYQSEISIKEIDNFFKNARQFFWVSITGGEPFLRPDLPEIIDIILTYCNKLSVLHFNTNGQLTTKAVNLVKFIRKNNPKLIVIFNVSIDGPPYLHDQIRGMQGAWDNAMNTFKMMKDMGSVKSHISFTLSTYNIGRFRETFESLKAIYPHLRFDDLSVNIFQKSGIYYGNQGMPDSDESRICEEIKEILHIDSDSFSINNFLRRTYLKLYLAYFKTKKYPLRCQALSSTCFLDPYGNLFPCVVYNKKLLNVKQMHDNLSSFWENDYARRIHYECSNNICPSCWSTCDVYSAIGGSIIKSLFKREN